MIPIRIVQLSSGWWRISGHGPNDWSQPPVWPCDLSTLILHAFPGASDEFFAAAMEAARGGAS